MKLEDVRKGSSANAEIQTRYEETLSRLKESQRVNAQLEGDLRTATAREQLTKGTLESLETENSELKSKIKDHAEEIARIAAQLNSARTHRREATKRLKEQIGLFNRYMNQHGEQPDFHIVFTRLSDVLTTIDALASPKDLESPLTPVSSQSEVADLLVIMTKLESYIKLRLVGELESIAKERDGLVTKLSELSFSPISFSIEKRVRFNDFVWCLISFLRDGTQVQKWKAEQEIKDRSAGKKMPPIDDDLREELKESLRTLREEHEILTRQADELRKQLQELSEKNQEKSREIAELKGKPDGSINASGIPMEKLHSFLDKSSEIQEKNELVSIREETEREKTHLMESLQARESDIRRLQQVNNDFKAKLQAREAQIHELELKLEAQRDEINRMTYEYQDMENDLMRAQSQSKLKTEEIGKLRRDIEESRAFTEKRMLRDIFTKFFELSLIHI
eukprot:TRINITY_DN5421_c0_g1_i1.p1 TRINITY_DN5421_c0_g1~~TRINITY_DN5421_c0_g1_i1.p1  ORF type:complete len:452 (+),score=131.38 TRINITY_DN5421_c0_g1_i1:417-1772(+)